MVIIAIIIRMVMSDIVWVSVPSMILLLWLMLKITKFLFWYLLFCIPLVYKFLLGYHWDFLINSMSIAFCVIVSYMFLQKSCTPDVSSPWFLFLFKCLSSCKCCDLMLLCLTLMILLNYLSKLFGLWLIISTSWWYWSFLDVMSNKKTSHLNFSLYSSTISTYTQYPLGVHCLYHLFQREVRFLMDYWCHVILMCSLPC